MALAYDGAIQRLIDAFAHLPGIGPKGAQRIAFYLLNASDEEAQTLVDAITEVKEKIRFCDVCGNVCETSPCPICVDPRRDHSVICVVEEPKDVMSIERTREYRGLYHVLGGVISPQFQLFPKYDRGIFEEEGHTLCVSAGLGDHTISPRFFNPAELPILIWHG